MEERLSSSWTPNMWWLRGSREGRVGTPKLILSECPHHDRGPRLEKLVDSSDLGATLWQRWEGPGEDAQLSPDAQCQWRTDMKDLRRTVAVISALGACNAKEAWGPGCCSFTQACPTPWECHLELPSPWNLSKYCLTLMVWVVIFHVKAFLKIFPNIDFLLNSWIYMCLSMPFIHSFNKPLFSIHLLCARNWNCHFLLFFPMVEKLFYLITPIRLYILWDQKPSEIAL